MSTLKVDGIRSNSASSDAITLASNGTCTANITNNLSNRNFIINGAFQISQRGNVTMGSSSAYTLDRWRAACGSSFNWDSAVVSQSTTSPDGFSNSLKVDIANTETPTAGQNALIQQKIEAQNLQSLAFGTSSAKQCTLSFHVRSNKTGTYCVQITQPDASKYVLFEYSISSADTWEKKTITISGNTADVIANDNGGGFEVDWHLACHSDDHVAATTSWASSGAFKATSNQVNLFDNASNEWYLAGVQLELGSVATDFEHRSVGQELALCQRYFYKIVPDGTNKVRWFTLLNNNEHYRKLNIDFPTIMRTSCTVSNISFINSANQSCTAQFSCEDHVTLQSAVNTNQAYAGLYGADFSAEL